MQQFRVFSDERHPAYCACCGGRPSTREHVPPKVFLDRPYPENLPVTETCPSCNEGASLDEEYLACWVECWRLGTTVPAAVERTKVKRLLSRKPALRRRLGAAVTPEGVMLDIGRAERVVVKTARCHVAYEMSERVMDAPSVVRLFPLYSLDPTDRLAFESPSYSPVFPEIGSRAFQRRVRSSDAEIEAWVEVQPGRYRYVVSQAGGVGVRSVVSEAFAAEVYWSEG